MKTSAKKGIDGLIGKKGAGKAAPTTPTKARNSGPSSSVERGLPEGFTRATFILEKESLDALKTYSRFTGEPIKDVMNDAINEYITKQKRLDFIKKAVQLNKEAKSFRKKSK